MGDYSELKRLAEAATQGPWHHYQHGVIKGGPVVQFSNGSAQQQIVMTTGAEWMRDGEQYDNANFIAYANPLAVLELISELQRLTADNASLRGSCAKLGAEHAGMVRTVRKQEKELDGLRKDAGRYRFIVDCPIRTLVVLSRKAKESDFDLSAECDQIMDKREEK